jgi:hypothetical protein
MKERSFLLHKVKCYYCGQTFDRDKEEFVKGSERRYAHKKCSENAEEIQSQEDKDKEALEQYIMKLFNIDYITPMIRKQIKQYIEEYHYTYSGIRKALIYFYEVKRGSLEKACQRISIVPYVYQNAYRYYYSLWEAQQRNANKNIQLYIPKVKEIVIPPPTVKVKKRKMFTFLDEEEEG